MVLTYFKNQLSSILYVLCNELQGQASYTHPLPSNIDVPLAHDDIDVGDGDPDIHFSGRLWLRRRVRQSFFTSFITLNVVDILIAL